MINALVCGRILAYTVNPLLHCALAVGGLPRDDPASAATFAQRLAKTAKADAVIAIDPVLDATTGGTSSHRSSLSS